MQESEHPETTLQRILGSVAAVSLISSAVLRLLAPGWILFCFGVFLVPILVAHAVIQYRAIIKVSVDDRRQIYLLLASDVFLFLSLTLFPDGGDSGAKKIPLIPFSDFYLSANDVILFGAGLASLVFFVLLFWCWGLILSRSKDQASKN